MLVVFLRHGRTRDDLVDAGNHKALRTQVNANQLGQFLRIGAQRSIDQGGRLPSGVIARNGDHLGQLRRGQFRLGFPRLHLLLPGFERLFGAFLRDVGSANFGFHFRKRLGVRGRIAHYAAGSQFVGAQIHCLGVALLVERIRTEQRREKLRVGQRAGRACRWRARHVVGRLHGQLQFVGGGLQAVGLLIHAVAEFFGQLAKALLGFLGAVLVLELGAGLLERRHTRGLDFGQANDVVAKIALDHVADVARLGQGKGGFCNRRVGAAVVAEKAQVTAAGRADVVLRGLARHIGKSIRGFAQRCQQGFGCGLGFLAIACRRILGRGDQDVGGAPLLRLAQLGAVLLVVLAQILLVDFD